MEKVTCLKNTSDLHEHAEAGFEQVSEASRHVLDVRAFTPVRVEHLLNDLLQKRMIGCLQKHQITQTVNQVDSCFVRTL